MSDQINEVPATSPNFQSEVAQKLASLFPEVIADGKIDVAALQMLLGEDAAGGERFGLFWPGKTQAITAAQTPTTATLAPDHENSVDWENTQNVVIEGDNLEVMKILQKHYYAITEGQLEDKATLIFSLLKEDGQLTQSFNQGGKQCITEYEVMKRYRTECLIKVHLQTGRTHQIRAGFAGIGHPLCGDTLYGGSTQWIKRPALHCARIEFLQPFTKEKMILESPLPEDMKRK